MLKEPLLVLTVVALVAQSLPADAAHTNRLPTLDSTPELKDAPPQRGVKQWTRVQRSSRWPRRASSENIYFPTKEIEDYINAHRVNRPIDAIVFPGNSVTKPVFNTDFGYGPKDGPHTWKNNYPTCNGNHQSPIDIKLDVADFPSPGVETGLFFNNYDATPLEMAVENTGHSLRLTGNWTTGRRPTISGFVLDGEYSFAEVHFHWGADNHVGSEHLVQGHSHPMEMHVVNYKASYGTFKEATTKKDGLVVISYFFKVHHLANPGLQKLLVAFKDITNPKSPGAPIEPFTLDQLVHPFTGKYASYLGSLTTPPCSEIVRWIVNLEPQFVSSEQLEKLRGLKRGDGERIRFNFRPVQNLNGRSIVRVH